MQIKIKKLHQDAVVPEYKTSLAAGFDLVTTEDAVMYPACLDIDGVLAFIKFDSVVLGTGLAFEIPEGYELEIRGRSGLAFKNEVVSYNGTIDADYRGEVKLKLWNLGQNTYIVRKGDRVAQGIIKRVEQVQFIEADELSETYRGADGFGHSGVRD